MQDLGIELAPILKQNMGDNPSLQHFMDVSNKALGNLVLVPHLNELLTAFEAVNANLDFSQIEGIAAK